MKAAIFDLDGTLFDSLGIWGKIDIDFFKKRGKSLPLDYQEKIRGMSVSQTASYTVDTYFPNESPDDVQAEWMRMCSDEYVFSVQLKPGAYEYLNYLYARGVMLAVATTLPKEMYEPALTRLGVYHLFSAFATTDEVGSEKSTGKVYLLAAEKIGVNPLDCVVYEDIPEGIRGAKNVGMKAFLVKDSHHNAQIYVSDIVCDGIIDTYECFETADWKII